MADFFDDTPLTTSRDPRGSTGSYSLDPRAVRAVMMQESGGDPSATGKAGEIGLMQIMPKTGASLGYTPESLRDPQTNLQAGTKLLQRLYTKYGGDLNKTFAAYNAGEGAVDRGKIPASTQKYVAEVLARMGRDTGPARPNVFAQTQIDPRGSTTTPADSGVLARFLAAYGPGRAEAAEQPPTQTAVRSQALTPITGGTTPLAAGAGFHPTFDEPVSPRTRMVLDALKHGLQMPDLAMRVPAHLLYRTMLSGTPFNVNTVATQHPWIAKNLPGFAGLDPSTGKPAWGVQNLQRGADFGADVATDLVEGRLPVPAEKMLGLESPYSTLTRKMRDLELRQRLERLAELARDPKWREAFETVRQERPIMAAERAAQQAALPAAQRGVRRWVLDPGSGFIKGDVKELLRALMGASLQQVRQQPSGAPTATPTAPISPLSRLEAAWGPGTAQAAEGPPSAADIERDKARRATGGPPSAADIAADKARRGAPDEANAPWQVKAAGWAPLITQTAGDVALSTLAAPYALGATALGGPAAGLGVESTASAAGSAGGYVPGEILNRMVRGHYGYPNPTWQQEEWNTGEAAAWGFFFGPVLKLLGHLMPATFKAGRATLAESKEAGAALGELRETVSQKLGAPAIRTKLYAELNPRAIAQRLDQLDRMPAQVRERGLTFLRQQVGLYVQDAASYGDTALQQLAKMKSALRKIPDPLYHRLYNVNRAELESLIDTTVRNYGKFYKYPEMGQAVRAAIEQAPTRFRDSIIKHFKWMLGGMGLYYTLRGGAAHLIELGVALGGMLASSLLINSPPLRALYARLLESESAPMAARIARSFINALGTRLTTGGFAPTPTQEPAAAPEAPAAEPTPSAAPTPRPEYPPAPPSESVAEIPSTAPTAEAETTE